MSEVVTEEKKIQRQIWTIIDEQRVVQFSDAVFAFAATLLVLKIDLPQGVQPQSFENFSTLFLQLWPEYLVNIISFLLIGYYWLNHHAIFGLVRKINGGLVWLNLVFLIFLSFLPFPVDLHGSYPTVPVVVIFYSVSLALVGFLQAAIWYYASRNRLLSSEVSRKESNYYLAQNLLAPAVFTLSIPLVAVHPLVAQFSWVFILMGAVLLKRVFGITQMTQLQKTII